jgi:pyruvate ferredoxin oxidoreductase delta subunit
MTWQDLELGAIVTEPGNAAQYQTGDWRSQKPIHDFSRCISCGICYIFCPEGCVSKQENNYFAPDLFYCKGCGICSAECPTGVITMVEEIES